MELAARQTKGGGYVDKNRNFYIILFSCCVFFLLLRGENMANGGREKAPAQNSPLFFAKKQIRGEAG